MFINKHIGDRRVAFASLALLIFGSLMIASAEMGTIAGDTEYLSSVIMKQALFALAGIVVYLAAVNFRFVRLRIGLYYVGYVAILIALLACRFFGMTNGAYAWISFGPDLTLQPSEFAKVFMIAFGARLLGYNHPQDNLRNFYLYGILSIIYFAVVYEYQHDLGSAAVLLVICFTIMLIPSYKEYTRLQKAMFVAMLCVICLALFMMSKPATEFLKKHSDNYMAGRFLAAADPFLYQYDNGYHIIMSLVSFANGGWFGLGYGNSIHKYMNFPNPSNDFILPVIVEELGILGFCGLIIAYGLMLYPIIAASLKAEKTISKIVLLGTFMYFITHFILNVGGVSGLIPLTGVPLLLISSGGSSLLASMISLGLSQNELITMEMRKNAGNSR